ncbi:hypothetical protein E2C01_020924 [Portunus trituberculatus]|uniref:Uncharacterized protein n=1 Tax=Portunus trituberculatus TaxID=210409 RepID=A0A5B7E3L3_PORTR|nr:hypothetical protein [Portunus trituberculatus]
MRNCFSGAVSQHSHLTLTGQLPSHKHTNVKMFSSDSLQDQPSPKPLSSPSTHAFHLLLEGFQCKVGDYDRCGRFRVPIYTFPSGASLQVWVVSSSTFLHATSTILVGSPCLATLASRALMQLFDQHVSVPTLSPAAITGCATFRNTSSRKTVTYNPTSSLPLQNKYIQRKHTHFMGN